jgi:hypothetical protein
MHSCPITAESISTMNSLLRRPAACCTTMSIGLSCSAPRKRAVIALWSASPDVQRMSTATPESNTRDACAVASTPTATMVATANMVEVAALVGGPRP